MKKISIHINENKKKADGRMMVYLRIRDERNKEFLLSTELMTSTKFNGLEFPKSETGHTAKTSRLNAIYAKVEEFIIRNSDMPLEELKENLLQLLGRKVKKVKVLVDYIEDYAATHKPSTAKLYMLTADRVREYDKDVDFDTLTKAWLEGFEKHLRENNGLSVNGIAQKMRNIRAVVNWCIDNDLTTNYPFRGRNGYHIKEEETPVNDLTAQEFADLRDYPCEPWQEVYRDLFCLSVYLAGINGGDLLLCDKAQKGYITYIRQKTNKKNATKVKPITVPVYKEAQAIINKYKGKKHLLYVMDEIKDYHTFMQHWDKALKKIGPKKIVPDKVGKLRKIEYHPILPDITTYSSRYTFASIAANDLDISEQTVGKCLGHAWSKEVTARYISSDQKKIDQTIRRVISYLNTFKGRY